MDFARAAGDDDRVACYRRIRGEESDAGIAVSPAVEGVVGYPDLADRLKTLPPPLEVSIMNWQF